MIHHIEYTTAERELALLARKLAMNRDVLYHGTRYRQSILKTETLFCPEVGVDAVFFTRSPEVAAYWALLKRDDDESRADQYWFVIGNLWRPATKLNATLRFIGIATRLSMMRRRNKYSTT